MGGGGDELSDFGFSGVGQMNFLGLIFRGGEGDELSGVGEMNFLGLVLRGAVGEMNFLGLDFGGC